MREQRFAERHDLRPHRHRQGNASSLKALGCASGLVAAATLGLGILYGSDAPQRPVVDLLASPTPISLTAKPADIALVRQRGVAQQNALLDPAFTGYEAAPFARSAPLRSRFEHANPPTLVVEAALESDESQGVDGTARRIVPDVDVPPLVRDIPLPMPRPGSATPRSVAAPSTRYALRDAPATKAMAPPSDGRTLLERMFGAPTPSAAPTPALAYATPGDTGGGFFGSRGPASAGTGTAVYNIARHTVTLPDGTQLEAHSGLGVNLDNPDSATQHMRGATPPSLYDLSQREALFHGIRALRLTPLLAGTTFGRGGLLAHTFMLGPRGDSNGCVVFRDYTAFLTAYDSGKIRRLLVVAGT